MNISSKRSGRLVVVSLLSLLQFGNTMSGTGPEDDDWEAERFVAPAMQQLGRLGDWIVSSASGRWADVFTPDARCGTSAEPGETRTHVAIRTIRFDEVRETTQRPRVALKRWAAPFRRGDTSISFKLVGFDRTAPTSVRTRVRVEVRSRSDAGLQFEVDEWEVDWDTTGERPRISRLRSLSGNRLESKKELFSDQSGAVLGPLASHPTVALGAEYWLGRIDDLGEPNLMGHHGIAVGDLDGDGLEDVYVAAGTGLPNRLLSRRPDGTVRDVGDTAGVAWLDDTKGVLIVDTDNDGDRDLVTALGNTIVLAKNDGRGRFDRFVHMKAPSSAPFYSLSAADFDLDGDLDLYGVRYVEQSYGVSVPVPFHDANNGPSNHLLRNDGEDRFVDVTAAVGLDVNNRRFSLIGAWADYDADGDPDLYVANDFGRNNLYRNDGGTFTDVAAETGTEDQAAGMGAAWSDQDADGDFDLYVTNMYSAAGRRVAYQDRFHADLDPNEREAIRRHSLGNTLFVNDDGFEDVSDEAGVRMGRWGWGAIWLDWDNDGLDDILVPNGFLSGPIEDDL